MMRASAFAKNSWREIRRTLGRYIAILAIIALGVGFFSGLRVMRQAMVRTADEYLHGQQFYDFRLLSTMGFTQRDAESLSGERGVAAAGGSVSGDFLIENEDGTETPWKALMISEINAPLLKAGRMPERADEVLADHLAFTEEDIGRTITVAETEEGGSPLLYREYTITGLCSSPLYLSVERGTTALGSGKLAGFLCFLPQGLDTEVFTELYVVMEGSGEIFSDEYEQQREKERLILEEALERLAGERFQEVLNEAEEEYADAEEEFLEGKRTYQEERRDAEAELDEALAALEDSKRELEEAKEELDRSAVRLADAEEEIRKGENRYYDGCASLEIAREEYKAKRAGTEADFAEIFDQSERRLVKIRFPALSYEPSLLGNLRKHFQRSARFFHTVTRAKHAGARGSKEGYQSKRQFRRIHNGVAHRPDKGKMHARRFAFHTVTKSAGSIQERNAALQTHPLLPFGDAGLIARHRLFAAAKGVDQGGFAGIGHTYHHRL